MELNRGAVTAITVTVTYPNGATKTREIPIHQRLVAILCTESLMDEAQKMAFTRSRDDWQKNPAMVIIDQHGFSVSCDFPDCMNA
jgi:hypothetical protein